jgi:hypothetical protein
LPLLIVLVVSGVAVGIGWRIGNSGLTYQDIIMAAVVGAVVVIFLQRRGLEIGYLLWIGLFILGYRMTRLNSPMILDLLANGGTITPTYFATGNTPIIQLHPLELVILGLFSLRMLRQIVSGQRLVGWRLPKLLWVFSIFWLWGWIPGASNGITWYRMLPEFLHFALIFPVFIVTAAVLEKQSFWKPVTAVFFGASTFIAFFGLLEYTVPSIRTLLPGFVTAQATESLTAVSADGFVRATFSFWGTNAAASFICLLAIPMTIPLLTWTRRIELRVVIVIAAVIQLVAIYIGGYRSMWMTLSVMIAVVVIMRLGAKGLVVLGAAFLFIFSIAPDTAKTRLQTGISATQGNFQDSSALKRWTRVEQAFTQATSVIMGSGWAAAGWAHSDFIQVFTNLGIVAGITFPAWYLLTLIGAGFAYRRYPRDALIIALLGSFLGVGALLLIEGVSVYPQLAMPTWFIWAMIDVRTQQLKQQETALVAA